MKRSTLIDRFASANHLSAHLVKTAVLCVSDLTGARTFHQSRILMGCGCSSVVEHTPRKLEVGGFESRQVLGFYLLLSLLSISSISLPTFLHLWSFLNQVP